MANNYCMTINLTAFIGSKVIEVEDENGIPEKGVFIPIDKNELYQSHGRVFFGAFVTEKTYNTGDNKSHFVKQRVTGDHIKKLASLGYKCPYLGSLYPTSFTPNFQLDPSRKLGSVSNAEVEAASNTDIPF